MGFGVAVMVWADAAGAAMVPITRAASPTIGETRANFFSL